MRLDTAIKRIKNSAHDVSNEYTNSEILSFLNESMQQTASLLIGMRYSPLTKEITLKTGDDIPKNYMCSAGFYPIEITNNKVILINEYETIKFRYFATPDNMTAATTELPFNNDVINDAIVKYAIMIALNENEFELTQDKVLFDTLQQAVASCIK